MVFLYWRGSMEETPPELREAYRSLLCGPRSDLAWRIYTALTDSPGLTVDELAEELGVNHLRVRRALWSLERLGLAGRRIEGRVERWYASRRVYGVVRLNPYAVLPSPGELASVDELAGLLRRLAGLEHFVARRVEWFLRRDGILTYRETRRILRLSERPLPLGYATIVAPRDPYRVVVRINGKDAEHEEHRVPLPGGLEAVYVYPGRGVQEKVEASTPIGGSVYLEVEDSKRIVVCRGRGGVYVACFPNPMAHRGIYTLSYRFRVAEQLRLVAAEVVVDGRRLTRLEAPGSGESMGYRWMLETRGFGLECEAVKAGWINVLLELEPRYRSDAESWIVVGGEGCDPCRPLIAYDAPLL